MKGMIKMVQAVKRLGLVAFAVVLFLSTIRPAHAVGNFYLPTPTMSVSGNRVTISFPSQSIDYVFYDYNSGLFTGMDVNSSGLIIMAQAFVPGLPVFELIGANTSNLVGNPDRTYRWDATVLNSTVELPFPGTRYAIWVEAFYDKMKGFYSGSGSGVSAASAMRLRARSIPTWYVTTQGTPPNWFASGPDVSGIQSALTSINNNFTNLLASLATINSYLSRLGADTQPPTLSLMWEQGAAITSDGSYNLIIIASDDRSPDAMLQMRINGGAWQAYRSSVRISLATGANEVTVEVKDQAGNTVSAKSPTLWKQ